LKKLDIRNEFKKLIGSSKKVGELMQNQAKVAGSYALHFSGKVTEQKLIYRRAAPHCSSNKKSEAKTSPVFMKFTILLSMTYFCNK